MVSLDFREKLLKKWVGEGKGIGGSKFCIYVSASCSRARKTYFTKYYLFYTMYICFFFQ